MRIGFLLAAALLATAPAAAQRRIEDPGPIRHRAADAVFPPRVGEFERTSAVSYRPDDTDISAGYVLTRGSDRLVVTIYIYPASRVAAAPGSSDTTEVAQATLCDSEFQGVGRAIVQAYGQVETMEVGRIPPPQGLSPAFALRSVHRFQAEFFGRRQPVRSEARLYCYVGGRWLVKYRATANDGFADPSVELERFIAQGPWPGRAPGPDTVAP